MCFSWLLLNTLGCSGLLSGLSRAGPDAGRGRAGRAGSGQAGYQAWPGRAGLKRAGPSQARPAGLWHGWPAGLKPENLKMQALKTLSVEPLKPRFLERF